MQPGATITTSQTSVTQSKQAAFDAYVTWCALGGLVIEEEWTDQKSGEPVTNYIRNMTLTEFSQKFAVDRATIWRWKKNTPNMADLIEKRRNEITPLARMSKAWNQLFLLGMQNKDKRAAVEALKLYIGHFGNLQLPKQRTEVEAGTNLIDLVNAARNKKVIEAEVVESDSNT